MDDKESKTEQLPQEPVKQSSSELHLCKHRDKSCVLHALKGLLRGLIIGYGLRAVIGLIGALLMRKLYRKYILDITMYFRVNCVNFHGKYNKFLLITNSS